MGRFSEDIPRFDCSRYGLATTAQCEECPDYEPVYGECNNEGDLWPIEKIDKMRLENAYLSTQRADPDR